MADDTSLEYEPGVLRVFQTKDETKAFYNKIAKVYDLLAEHSEQPMRDIGIEMLAAQAGETILEIGFGTGHCLVELARAVGPSGTVLGIDLSESMVEETRALIEEEQLEDRIELHCGDALDCPSSRNRSTAFSPALRSNCSTRRSFPKCWRNGGAFSAPAVGWPSWRSPRKASKASS